VSEPFRLRRTVTGTTWANVFGALWEQTPRGVDVSEGASVPKWTCREAVAVCWALKRTGSMPGWYQYAAVAYDWNPDTGNIDQSDRQADSQYPAYAEILLRGEVKRAQVALEQSKPKDPSLDVEDVYDLPDVQSEMLMGLKSESQFKIPLPACKGKNGKPTMPIYKDGKLQCPGGLVTIDDPITASSKSLLRLAVLIGAGYLGYKWLSRGRGKGVI
jgi:hypothetical protein